MFDLFLFGEKVMKISRNELRRMILETILSGERNDLLIDKQLVEQTKIAPRSEQLNAVYKAYKGSPNNNIDSLVELLKQDKSENKKDFFVDKTAYDAFMKKVPGLEDALKKAEDTKKTSDAKEAPKTPAKTNTAEKKKKIEDIQRAINGLIDETRLKTNKVSENGNWSDRIDVALKAIFEHFMIENPGREWTVLAKELNEKPTLSGLLGYLAKLKLRSGEYDSPSVERVLTAAEQASRKEQEELAAALGWDSDGSPLTFLDDLSQTPTGSAKILKFTKDPEYAKLYLNKESVQKYGKSHATLIRERYWGRY